MDGFSLDSLLQWIGAHPQWAGLSVFAVACVESLAVVGILVPGMSFMIGTGALIGLGVLDFWSMCAWAVAGAIVGDGLSYWLGWHYREQLRHVWPLSRHPDLVARGEVYVRRHGGKSVLLGRFVGPLRAIVPAIAGMLAMSPWRFYAMNVLSAVLWAPVAIAPGILFGASIGMASTVAVRLAILVLLLLMLIWLAWWLLMRTAVAVRPHVLKRHPDLLAWLERHGPLTAGISVAGMAVLLLIWIGIYFAPWRAGPEPTDAAAWLDARWRELPGQRAGMFGADGRFNLQYAGSLDSFAQLLHAQGWRRREHDMMPLLHWLKPDPVWSDLPLWPRFHRGHADALRLVRLGRNPDVIEVLRLWPSGWQIADIRQPLWIGSMERCTLRRYVFDFALPGCRGWDKRQLQEFARRYEVGLAPTLRQDDDGAPLLLLIEGVP